MVAPHETGDLVRSLVRVPGSGSDRSAGSECLDLARASTLAASVPVPKTLPAALASPKVPQQSKNEKLVGQTGPAADVLGGNSSSANGRSNTNGDRKRQRPEEPAETGNFSSESSAPKRPRIVYMTPEQVLSHASRMVSVSTAAGPLLFLPLQPSTSNSPPSSLREASVSQLIQERNTLRQENQVLQQQLALFQQLFKDKKRLGSVVKRLGVKIP